jgi:hypothetical protein
VPQKSPIPDKNTDATPIIKVTPKIKESTLGHSEDTPIIKVTAKIKENNPRNGEDEDDGNLDSRRGLLEANHVDSLADH